VVKVKQRLLLEHAESRLLISKDRGTLFQKRLVNKKLRLDASRRQERTRKKPSVYDLPPKRPNTSVLPPKKPNASVLPPKKPNASVLPLKKPKRPSVSVLSPKRPSVSVLPPNRLSASVSRRWKQPSVSVLRQWRQPKPSATCLGRAGINKMMRRMMLTLKVSRSRKRATLKEPAQIQPELSLLTER